MKNEWFEIIPEGASNYALRRFVVGREANVSAWGGLRQAIRELRARPAEHPDRAGLEAEAARYGAEIESMLGRPLEASDIDGLEREYFERKAALLVAMDSLINGRLSMETLDFIMGLEPAGRVAALDRGQEMARLGLQSLPALEARA